MWRANMMEEFAPTMSSSTSSRSLASAPHAALTPQCSRAAAPPPTPPPPTTTSCQHRCLSRILGSEAEAGAGAVNAAAASAFLDALDATFRSETIAACVRTAATSTPQPPAPPGSASRSVAVAGSEAGAVPAAPCRSTPPMPPPPSAAQPTSPPPAPPSGPLHPRRTRSRRSGTGLGSRDLRSGFEVRSGASLFV